MTSSFFKAVFKKEENDPGIMNKVVVTIFRNEEQLKAEGY
jgi:hypothetical protein